MNEKIIVENFKPFVTKMPVSGDEILVEGLLKKYLLRDFRKMLKHTFNFVYGDLRYYRCKRVLEKMAKDFFTGDIWKNVDTKDLLTKEDAVVLRIPEHIFDKHKDIFSVLIYSTSILQKKLSIENTADI